jgi:hypothetical protein
VASACLAHARFSVDLQHHKINTKGLSVMVRIEGNVVRKGHFQRKQTFYFETEWGERS